MKFRDSCIIEIIFDLLDKTSLTFEESSSSCLKIVLRYPLQNFIFTHTPKRWTSSALEFSPSRNLFRMHHESRNWCFDADLLVSSILIVKTHSFFEAIHEWYRTVRKLILYPVSEIHRSHFVRTTSHWFLLIATRLRVANFLREWRTGWFKESFLKKSCIFIVSHFGNIKFLTESTDGRLRRFSSYRNEDPQIARPIPVRD